MEKQNFENINAKRNCVVDEAVITRSKKAFTLAETLIALTILGIVAAIVVPALVRNHIENANRVKLKKAMSVYDYGFNKMVVENGIKGNAELETFAPLNDCTNTSEYFKIAETLSDDNGTNCRFRTMDGTFWDISDIKKPIVALKEEDLNEATAESGTNRAFYLYAWFDENGSIRVNDLAAISEDDRESLQALYDYINGLTKTSMKEVAKVNYTAEWNKFTNGDFSEDCYDGNHGEGSQDNPFRNCTMDQDGLYSVIDSYGNPIYSQQWYHRQVKIGGYVGESIESKEVIFDISCEVDDNYKNLGNDLCKSTIQPDGQVCYNNTCGYPPGVVVFDENTGYYVFK